MELSTSDRPLSAADYATLASFRRVLRTYLRFSEHRIREQGLAPVQYLALLAIEAGDVSPTVGSLARWLEIAPHSAAELVNRLEAANLAQRQPDASDGRQVRVSLTSRGRATLDRLAAIHHEELQTTGPLLIRELARLTACRPDRSDHENNTTR